MSSLYQNPLCVDNLNGISDDENSLDMGEEDQQCPVITLTKEEKIRLRKPWQNALIIKLFDKRMRYEDLVKVLRLKWSLKGDFVLTDVGCAYYIARFTNMDDHNFVMTQGPWMIGDSYLTIQKWIPNFIPDEEPIKVLTAWVRIPNLSVEYFDKQFLYKIGEKIGRVIKIDRHTESMNRGQYIRFCVEIDITKPLLSKFRLNGRVWGIQYEGLRQICFKCGKLGHKEDKFPKFVKDDATKVQESNYVKGDSTPAVKKVQEEEQYGSWMIVQRPAKKSIQRNKPGRNQQQQQQERVHRDKQNPPNRMTEKVNKDRLQVQSKDKTPSGLRFDVLSQDTVMEGHVNEEIQVNDGAVLQEDDHAILGEQIKEVPLTNVDDDHSSVLGVNMVIDNLITRQTLNGSENISQAIPTVNLGEDNSFMVNNILNKAGENRKEGESSLSNISIRLDSQRIPTFKGKKDLRTTKLNSPLNLGVKGLAQKQNPFKDCNIAKGKLDSRKNSPANPRLVVSCGKENLHIIEGQHCVGNPNTVNQLEVEKSRNTNNESPHTTGDIGGSHPPGVHNVYGGVFRRANNGNSPPFASQGGSQCELVPTTSPCAQGDDGIGATSDRVSGSSEGIEGCVHEYSA